MKQVFQLNKDKDDIRISEYGIKGNGGLLAGIVKDVIKLEESCKKDRDRYGIMLLHWVDTREDDNLNLNNVKNSIQRFLKKQHLKLKSERVDLLWSSGKRTLYVSLD